MQSGEQEVSIYEVLKDRKFEASVITTYNVYFPFYEDVVLRRLSASGARHNILIVDKKQLADCMKTPSLRPRLAGYGYTLVPMDFGGAFHPKIALFVERRKGILFVGSHNMTISGFGINRELTTKVDISAKEKSGVNSARYVFQSILAWVTTQQDLGAYYFETIQSLTQFAPWLKGKIEESTTGIQLYCSDSNEKSLWEKVKEVLPKRIKRVLSISPFFDSRLHFLSTAASELQIEEIIIGVEPSSVEIEKHGSLSGAIKFVDASQLYKKHGYLHAKAYLFEDHSHNHWLITGSANASFPAWLAGPSERNIEAIVLHKGELAITEAKKIGIVELPSFPELSETQWIEIAERRKKQKESETKSLIQQKTGTCLCEGDQLVLSEKLLGGKVFDNAICYDASHNILGAISKCEYLDGNVIISLKAIQTDIPSIRFVQLETSDKNNCFAYVHHREQIERKLVCSHQAQFRASLASLSSENPDIERLIVTVEKIIFDNPPEIPPHLRKDPFKKAAQEEGLVDKPKEIDSLAVHLKETSAEKKRIRLVRSGDLGHLLDVLIHHLGMGLEKSRDVIKDSTDQLGRSEEEQIGIDDAEQNDRTKIDPIVIVKTCNNKVRNLVGRMLKQLDAVSSKQEVDHVLPIVQLVAVLALLRELRLLDVNAPWMPVGTSLFPLKERERLLLGCIKYLYGASFHLFEKALQELTDEPKDEISRLRGLLLWLARDSGIDIRSRVILGETLEERRTRIINQYQMLCLAPAVSKDDIAKEEASISILHTANPIKKADAAEWLKKHLIWGHCLKGYIPKNFDRAKIAKRPPQTGDIVFNSLIENPTLFVVLRATNSLTNVVNFEKDNLEGGYATSCLAVLDIPLAVLAMH
ncbi:MAG: hypothetical protein KKD63_05765 [Proteobacteria bacterium]|nr:hypothetical protein [Desulfobulbaceae bacterium]MBU4152367.1 hypothetical protein [Pseudomonadota bacterium]